MTQSDIVSRIAKLLRLASSPHAAEAQSAMAKAMQLARQHNLDIARCADPDQAPRSDIEHTAIEIRRWSTEARLARSIVQDYFEVTVIVKPGRAAVFIGHPPDIAIARHVFVYAQAACRRSMRAAGIVRGRRRVSYVWGFFAGLQEALARAELRDPGVHGLVLAGRQARDIYIDERFLVLGTQKVTPPKLKSRADIAAGYNAGIATTLRRPLPPAASAPAMIGGVA